MIDKEIKQKNFADELKKQIEERDFLKKKEEWRKTRAAHFSETPNDNQNKINSQNLNQTAYNNPGEALQKPVESTFYPNDKTFYVKNNQN